MRNSHKSIVAAALLTLCSFAHADEPMMGHGMAGHDMGDHMMGGDKK